MTGSTSDALKQIEAMLHDIGAATPSQFAGGGSQNQSRAATKQTAHSQAQQKDCLAVETRNQFATPKFSMRSKSEEPSLVRGAPIAGKDNARKRFFGKGFQPPPAESPGPIYQPQGMVDESQAGKSFSRADRFRAQTAMAQRAAEQVPRMQSMPPSVGRQAESRMANSPMVAFSKADRWSTTRNKGKGSKAKEDRPDPGTYHPDILNLTEKGKSVSMSGSRSVPTRKIFISRAHIADCIGAASPGPMYHPDDSVKDRSEKEAAFPVHTSKEKRGPSFTFGMSDRPSDSRLEQEPDVMPSDTTCRIDSSTGKARRHCLNTKGRAGTSVRHTPMQKFISHEHSKVQCTTETPGPAYYNPDAAPTKLKAQGVSFAQESRDSNARFFSKALSLSKGKDSPGLKYSPNPDFVRPHKAAATFAGPADSATEPSDRFTKKVFLGKGMGENYGSASPGPAYSQELPASKKSPAWTIVHKEKHFNHVYPAPSRPRWVSGESAKENRGAFSPGPKYDTRTKEFGGSGPSYSFGVSDREFGPQFTEEERSKFGTADKPYTSPGEARYISNAHSRTARAGKSSPGPQNPNVNPNDRASSQVRRAPTVGISPAPTSKSRTAGTQNESGPELLNPAVSVTRPHMPAHAFGKAEKMPNPKMAPGPGPTHYTPKWDIMEQRVKGSSFGGLG